MNTIKNNILIWLTKDECQIKNLNSQLFSLEKTKNHVNDIASSGSILAKVAYVAIPIFVIYDQIYNLFLLSIKNLKIHAENKKNNLLPLYQKLDYRKILLIVFASGAFAATVYYGTSYHTHDTPIPKAKASDPFLSIDLKNSNSSVLAPIKNTTLGEITQPRNLQEKEIELVTGYRKGNLERDLMSKKVIENHETYAKKYNYSYIPYSTNQAEECAAQNGAIIECQPMWSKIAILRMRVSLYLSSFADSLKDRWIVWLDDDMPITNFNYKLSDIISKFIGGQKKDIILTKDIQNWNGGDAATSINTGAIFVRICKRSLAFLNKVWEMRNNPFASSTYGTCENQSCLHEQDIVAKILKEPPADLDISNIKVINPNFYGYGVNTIARGDYYHDLNRNIILSYGGDDNHERRWKYKDFCGQCSGIPTMGSKKYRGKPTNLRLACIDDLISSVAQ